MTADVKLGARQTRGPESTKPDLTQLALIGTAGLATQSLAELKEHVQ